MAKILLSYTISPRGRSPHSLREGTSQALRRGARSSSSRSYRGRLKPSRLRSPPSGRSSRGREKRGRSLAPRSSRRGARFSHGLSVPRSSVRLNSLRGPRDGPRASRCSSFPRLEGASLATIARAKFLARTKLLTRATRRTITTIFARLERAALAAVIARRPVIAVKARTRTIAITILAEALAFAGIRLGPMRFGSVGALVAEAAPTGLFVTEFLVTELAVAAGRGGTRGALAGKPALAPIPVAAASRRAATRAGAASVVFIVVAGHVRSRLRGA